MTCFRVLSLHISREGVVAEFIGFFRPMFRRITPTKTILLWDETIFRFWHRCPETADGYKGTNETAGTAGHGQPETEMRTTSFILAFAFVLVGPSMAGSSDGPAGHRYFTYNGSPVAVPALQPMVVAAK